MVEVPHIDFIFAPEWWIVEICDLMVPIQQ